jgi:hypothetical protein
MHSSVFGSLQTKIWSPTRIGEAFDFFGSGVFQITFDVADQVTGGWASGYMPVPSLRHPTGVAAGALDRWRRIAAHK